MTLLSPDVPIIPWCRRLPWALGLKRQGRASPSVHRVGCSWPDLSGAQPTAARTAGSVCTPGSACAVPFGPYLCLGAWGRTRPRWRAHGARGRGHGQRGKPCAAARLTFSSLGAGAEDHTVHRDGHRVVKMHAARGTDISSHDTCGWPSTPRPHQGHTKTRFGGRCECSLWVVNELLDLGHPTDARTGCGGPTRSGQPQRHAGEMKAITDRPDLKIRLLFLHQASFMGELDTTTSQVDSRPHTSARPSAKGGGDGTRGTKGGGEKGVT